jgi:hypothetical protein
MIQTQTTHIRAFGFVSQSNSFFSQLYELLNVVEFGFFQNALFDQILFQYQFAMSQIIQYRRKVLWVSIDEKRTRLVLQVIKQINSSAKIRWTSLKLTKMDFPTTPYLIGSQANCRVVLTELVEKRLFVLAQCGLGGDKALAANVQPHPFGFQNRCL